MLLFYGEIRQVGVRTRDEKVPDFCVHATLGVPFSTRAI